MHFKTIILQLFLIGFSNILKSQDSVAKNTIYAEILGNAAGISLNYDRVVLKKEKYFLSVGFGAGAVPANLINDALNNGMPKAKYVVYGIPIFSNLSFGKKNNHIETGLGFTFQQGMYGLGLKYSKTLFTVIRLGYRYQKEKGGFFWKIGITPFIPIKEFGTLSVPYSIVPWGGLAFGYTFKKNKFLCFYLI